MRSVCGSQLAGGNGSEGIPTSRFNEILAAYIGSGWEKQYEYDGMDAWIDYGRVDIEKGSGQLRFEWTNWLEGEISGPPNVLREIAENFEVQRHTTKGRSDDAA